MTYAQWSAARVLRLEAIRYNRSARMRGLQLRPVPVLPKQPCGTEVCEPDGTFLGFFPHTDREAIAADLSRLGIDPSELRFRVKPRFRD